MSDTEEQPTNTIPRKHYFIGAVIGAVLLLVIVILSILLIFRDSSGNSRHHHCELSKKVPDVKGLLKEYKYVVSANSTNLAGMVGYLFVYDRGFLPMVLEDFIVGPNDMSFTTQHECATLSSKYSVQNGKYNWGTMKLQLDGPVNAECDLSTNYKTSYGTDEMFSCKKRASFICRSKTASGYMFPVAELVMESLEFELMGDPSSIKKGKFDKTPYVNSCIDVQPC